MFKSTYWVRTAFTPFTSKEAQIMTTVVSNTSGSTQVPYEDTLKRLLSDARAGQSNPKSPS